MNKEERRARLRAATRPSVAPPPPPSLEEAVRQAYQDRLDRWADNDEEDEPQPQEPRVSRKRATNL